MMAWLARRRERRQRIRHAALQTWARTEVQRTQPPVCDRPKCYDGPHTTASRLEHGCIPTAYGIDFAPVASEDIMRDLTGEKAPADYDG